MNGASRDIGLTGAGKGSRPRNCGSKAFVQNYDEIFWLHKAPESQRGFKRSGARLRKVYR